MSNENVFLKKAFASGQLFTGFLEDPPDPRDYKFSDIMKKQGTLKTVKKKVKKLVSQERGSYRKAGYGKILKNVTVLEDVPTKILSSISPLKVDHSTVMSSVKNQGTRPTCVGFAGAAMKEFQEKVEHEKEIKEGKQGHTDKVYDYSEQWLYQNCKKIDGLGRGGGTYIRAVMKVMNKIGVPTESAWPYTHKGIDIGKPKFWAELIARWAVIGSYWLVTNLTEMKAALVDGPVIIGGPIHGEWAMPVHGVIKYPADPGTTYGGHAICAVGYDDEKQQIKIKNSWSRFWGDRGYGYIPYKVIEDFGWGGWAARDISVTKEMLKGPGEELTPLVW
jgi:C1A family cysteine protease